MIQDGPTLANTYAADLPLRAMLARLLPAGLRAAVEPDLERMGALAAGPLAALADQAEGAPPVHVAFDPWGRRVDRIALSPAWGELKRVAAEEGLVARGYDRAAYGEHARLVQMALVYLYAPSSAVYSCPLAMTDGAAKLIEALGDAALAERALPRLLARDPARFWTSGQWMTERGGGSDVGGGTETVARPEGGDRYRLDGVKWFTSAIDADVAFTLARPEGAPPGSRGLALFYVELRDADGRLQGIEVNRLKDKLGTRALPTAELTLAGAPARRLGEAGEGVRRITALMNVTRVWNACCAAAGMARGVQLAADYARRRRAFGRPLADLPLHRETLASLAAEHAGALALVLETARLWGREEAGAAGEGERAALRLLTPLVKLGTAKQAVALASEVLECMGGAGYVEDTGFPRLLRDAQVLAIWEGTTNVLALDLLRAVAREGALAPFVSDLEGRLGRLAAGPAPNALAEPVARTARALADLRAAFSRLGGEDGGLALERSARALALGLARCASSALLCEHAADAPALAPLARRFALGAPLSPPLPGDEAEAIVAALDPAAP